MQSLRGEIYIITRKKVEEILSDNVDYAKLSDKPAKHRTSLSDK